MKNHWNNYVSSSKAGKITTTTTIDDREFIYFQATYMCIVTIRTGHDCRQQMVK